MVFINALQTVSVKKSKTLSTWYIQSSKGDHSVILLDIVFRIGSL